MTQQMAEECVEDGDNDEEPKLRLRHIVIPTIVYLDSRVLHSEMFLLSFIEMLDNEKGCYASNRYLGELMRGMNPVTISTMISKLKGLGYITTESREEKNHLGQRKIIRVIRIAESFKKDRGYSSELKGGLKVELKPPLSSTLNRYKREEEREENNFLSKDRKLIPVAAPSGPKPLKSRPTLSLAVEEEEKLPQQEPLHSQEALDVVNYWNTKGKIFREHKKLNTKGMQRVLTLLDKKYLPKYGFHAVKGAIDRAARMAHDKGQYTKAPPFKLSLLDFLTNESAKYRLTTDNVSWFRRLLGERSDEKFLRYRDRYPEITRKLIEAYERYTTGQKVGFSPKQIIQFREAAERLQEYRSNGDRLGDYIAGATTDNYVRTLFEALANNRKEEDSSDIRIGQLCSDYTWNSVFPRYLTKMFT